MLFFTHLGVMGVMGTLKSFKFVQFFAIPIKLSLYILGIHDRFGTELAVIFSFHVGLTDSVMQRMQLFFSVSAWREKRLEMALIQISVPGPRKLQSHKRFLNIDGRPMAAFAFLPSALCFFI
jgi:hypothetical protein